MDKAILNPGEDTEFECTGFKRNVPKSVCAHLISILCFGIPYLVGHWKPDWKVRWHRTQCALYYADTVMITPKHGVQYATLRTIAIEPVADELDDDYVHRDVLSHDDLENISDRSRLLRSAKLTLRYFIYRHARYIWNNRKGSYVRLHGLDKGQSISKFSTDFTSGLTKEEQTAKQSLYGPNSVDVEVKTYFTLFLEEVFHPFYVFQIGSIILWSLDEYMYYASCIFLISVISIIVSLIETRRQNQSLHDMVASSNKLKVQVFRAGRRISTERVPEGNYETSTSHETILEEIGSNNVVPGDVISIPPHGCLMTCDAVLITGTCIVNESMLTGESVPVTKSALVHGSEATSNDEDDGSTNEDDVNYDPEKHKRSTLFAGTSVIQTRFYGNSKVLAVVVRTGFETAKGDLIRSILFPKPIGFKFYRDSIRFVSILFCIAAMGMCYCVYVFVRREAPVRMVILRCLDIITIVVPPALPAAMTVGTFYAQNRLKKASIFCISPQRINVCGKLKLVCFDKTGTLTEDGLDMWGVVPTSFGFKSEETDLSKSNIVENTCYSTDKNIFHRAERHVENLPVQSHILMCLASCHSLTLIDNELIGDPLDIKMFESTNWDLEEAQRRDTSKFDMIMPTVVKPKCDNAGYFFDTLNGIPTNSKYPNEVGIIREFSFNSNAARMSVVTRALNDNNFQVYTKGAPEKLVELCEPDSIPQDFDLELKHYAMQGYRVIGLAHKTLPCNVSWHKVHKLKRSQVEKDLTFLGLLIMQNTLKPETTPVIKELKEANIRTVMITGDNLLTAVSVARDCKMLKTKDRVIIVEAHPPKPTQPNGIIQFNYSDDQITAENESSSDADDISGYNNNDLMVMQRTAERQISNIEEGRRIKDQNYHFAMNGKTWATVKKHFNHMLPKLIQKGTIFARMAPNQKAELVEEFQDIDYIVSMCGDGANDCGALKAAHVGISLSEAEASVAAPFTSRIANITCVPTVIKEGRCALVTSFSVFKYMALYSMVQFISVLILYTVQTNLGDTQFLYIDLVITTTVAVLMGWTRAYDKLSPVRPPGSLVSGPNLFSIFSQIFLAILFQVGAYLYLTTLPWFKPVKPSTPAEEITLCFETTTVFLISSFQYLMLATAFSKGPPYRKSFYTNIPFALAVFVLTVFTSMLCVYPGPSLADFFEIKLALNKEEMNFKLCLLGFAVANTFICFFIEMVIVPSTCLKKVSQILMGKTKPKNKFKSIQLEMEVEEWPPQNCNGDDISNRVAHHKAPGIS